MLSMLIFAAAAAAPSPVIIANTSSASQPGVRCAAGDGVQAVGQKSGGAVGVQKLNELPNANEYRAVLRRDANGCDKPLIVNYDIGSAPRKQR